MDGFLGPKPARFGGAQPRRAAKIGRDAYLEMRYPADRRPEEPPGVSPGPVSSGRFILCFAAVQHQPALRDYVCPGKPFRINLRFTRPSDWRYLGGGRQHVHQIINQQGILTLHRVRSALFGNEPPPSTVRGLLTDIVAGKGIRRVAELRQRMSEGRRRFSARRGTRRDHREHSNTSKP